MSRRILLALLLSCSASAFAALPFASQHALVFDEDTGQVLLEKDAHAVVPIASLTKLMTAMVVLDAKLDMDETISIDESDVDTLKNSSSRVPVGAAMSRRTALELALMSSDNRAAAALGRTYPGGHPAFLRAVRDKLEALGMRDTSIEEPTGLSPNNRSSAADLVKMVTAAGRYPEIARITTATEDLIDLNGQTAHFRNTNRLVGRQGWDIQLSKTGFTREAGRCLVMRVEAAGKRVVMVFLNAKETALRILDAENVQRYLNGEPLLAAKATVQRVAHRIKPRKGVRVAATKSKGAPKLSAKGHKKLRTV